MEIIGRVLEKQVLARCLEARESKLVALYGRRRVGKTYLVRNFYKGNIIFDIAGLHKGNMTDQIDHFNVQLQRQGKRKKNLPPLKKWMDVFEALQDSIDTITHKNKKVIFIDELPWFDTPRSKFLMAFENFWNSYCTKRTDIILVICGSAASWMIKKILKNKGGLHNRVSEKIRLQPFTLLETEQFLKYNSIKWTRYDIAQVYMAVGGIPFYLKYIIKGESLVQFLERTCFTEAGMLRLEFDELFTSLFNKSHWHYIVMEALAKVKNGITRNKIIELTNMASGGTCTEILDELMESGFITKYLPFDNNINKALYRLSDFFTVFHLKFMQNSKALGVGSWSNKAQGQSWISWTGFAFESLCLQHIQQIKHALKLTAIYTEASSWQGNYDGQGAQIDLVLNRADRILNVCEAKFAKGTYTITKAYAKELRNKISVFGAQPICKNKNIFLVMISTYGVLDNAYAKELVQSQVVLDDLFI